MTDIRAKGEVSKLTSPLNPYLVEFENFPEYRDFCRLAAGESLPSFQVIFDCGRTVEDSLPMYNLHFAGRKLFSYVVAIAFIN